MRGEQKGQVREGQCGMQSAARFQMRRCDSVAYGKESVSQPDRAEVRWRGGGRRIHRGCWCCHSASLEGEQRRAEAVVLSALLLWMLKASRC